MADNTFVNFGGHKVSAGKKYSTSEVRTGDVWIDGKPIYRKVVSLGNLPNTTSKNVDSGITNLDKAISICGFSFSTNIFRPLPYVFNTKQWDNGIWLEFVTDKWMIRVICGADRSNETGYAIIEYTKTTD